MATKARAKTKTVAKKATLISTSFNFKSPLALSVIALVVAVGGLIIYKSFAATTDTFYYNSPHIGHNGARGSAVTAGNYDVGKSTAWRVDYWKDSQGHYDWYGPFGTIVVPSGAHGIRACVRYWLFAYGAGAYRAERNTGNPGTFDISINRGRSVGKLTINMASLQDRTEVDHGGIKPRTALQCVSAPLAPGTYHEVEARFIAPKWIIGMAHPYIDILRTSLSTY